MSKKIISIVLAVMLMVSMISVAMVSASAEVDANGRYAAAEDVDTNRYFFYMPDDWYNEYTSTAGVYWWDGTDACPTWQDMYAMYPADAANVWYVDVPTDVNTIIFTNFLDGGEDPEADVYVKAVQTTDIGCEYYDAGESPNYPDGTESFDNMIYVPDPDQTVENPFSGKLTYAGEWFYYHGNGQWDTTQGEVPTMPETPDEIPTTAPVEETTVPETDPVVTDPADDAKSFTVTATSNFSNTVSKTYSEADKTVTLTYYLKTDKKLIEGEFEFTYDPSILKFNEEATMEDDLYTVMPKIEAVGGDMTNIYDLESEGKAMFTFTNPSKMYNFTTGTLEENVLITATFDIVGDYTKDTEVNMNAKFLTGGEKVKVDGSTTIVRTPYVDYSTVQDAYANCENLTTLSEPEFVPTQPETTKPVETTEPTEETTVAPTETDPVSKSFTVTATSNFSNTVSKTYSEADKTVSLTYYLKTDKKLIEGEFEFTYDPSILKFNEEATMEDDLYTVMPKIEAVGGDMTNIYDLESEGKAMFTFTNPSKMYDFTKGTLEENVFITLTFDIVGDYTKDTEVNMNAKFLTGGEKVKVDGSTTIVRTPYVDYSTVQDAYANCENLTVLSEPAAVPTQPVTTEPVTTEPETTEPETTEPETTEPVTTEPETTEPETTEPTTVPSDKSFTVTAKSNFSNTAVQTYSEADKTVTLTYYLKTDKKLIEGELEFTYDPSILKFNEEATMEDDLYTVMPKIEAVGGDMTNIYDLESEGKAMFTFTNPSKMYDFTKGTLEDNVFITLTFDIVGDYTKDTEVFMNAKFLTGGEKVKVDGSTTVVRTPYVDYSETKPAYENCENLTVLSAPAVPVTTQPVETTEPVTTEPETTEPETTEPETTEPETTEPETTEPETTAPETTEPETTEPVAKEFTVTAKSNIANAVSQTYSEADKTVTVTYTLETLKKILSGSWTFNYDPSILQFQAVYTDLDNPTSVMPYIAAKGGDMQNLEVAPGEAIGSFSNANGYDFSTEQVLFTAVFDIVGDYTTDTEVVLIVDELLAGNVTSDNTIELERLVVDSIPGEGFTAKAYLSQFTPVEPTTAPVTTEPVTTEPVTTEPVTTEPVTTEPVTTEPVITEPVTTEPVTTEPVTTEPVTTEPVTTEPATTEPVTTEPVTTEPVTTEPVTTEPVTTEPVTTEPVTTEPVTTEPVTTEPATTEPATTEPADTTAPTTEPGPTSSVATPDNTPGGSTGNGTVQTSDSAMAFVLLGILVAATGFIIVLRKRETE